MTQGSFFVTLTPRTFHGGIMKRFINWISRVDDEHGYNDAIMFFLAQIQAPLIVAGIIDLPKLRLAKDWIDVNDEDPEGYLYIKLEYFFNESVWQTGDIKISNKTKRLEHDTGSFLYEKPYISSGVAGIVFQGILSVILFSPLILLCRLYQLWIGWLYSMSYRMYFFYKQLEPLIGETVYYKILRVNLSNTWKYEKKMSSRISFRKAKTFLDNCDRSSELTSHNREFLSWRDHKGDRVATALRYTDTDFLVAVNVFGTEFVGSQADELIKHYADR